MQCKNLSKWLQKHSKDTWSCGEGRHSESRMAGATGTWRLWLRARAGTRALARAVPWTSRRTMGCAAFRPQLEPQLPAFLTQHFPHVLHQTCFILAMTWSWQTLTSSFPQLKVSRQTVTPQTSIKIIDLQVLIYLYWCVSRPGCRSRRGKNSLVFSCIILGLGRKVGKCKLKEINEFGHCLAFFNVD